MSDTRTPEELRYAFISDLKAVWADDNLMCIEEYDRIIETYDTITARLEAAEAVYRQDVLGSDEDTRRGHELNAVADELQALLDNTERVMGR